MKYSEEKSQTLLDNAGAMVLVKIKMFCHLPEPHGVELP